MTSLRSIRDERRRELATFLLAFVFLGFLMKVAGEFIHEMGHAVSVLLMGGRVLEFNISFEWPFRMSYTRWELVVPSNAKIAVIAVAGIFMDVLTSVIGQSLLFFRKVRGYVSVISVFWLSFWGYISSVVYLLMGAIHPFGDIRDLLNVYPVPRLLLGSMGLTFLVSFTYLLSIILKNIFIQILGLVRSDEAVSFFWAALHIFFVSITMVIYGFSAPPVVMASLLVVFFIWSYLGTRWFLVYFASMRGPRRVVDLSIRVKHRVSDIVEVSSTRQRRLKYGYVLLFSATLISAVLTGYMVNQYLGTYRLVMKTDIKIDVTHFQMSTTQPFLRVQASVFNPTLDNLSLNKIEFDVKLNDMHIDHYVFREIESAYSLSTVVFEQVLEIPLDRMFTLEMAAEKGSWEWTVSGSGYVDTLFGETLLRFSSSSDVAPLD